VVLSRIDLLLIVYAGFSLVSALLARNGWLATRALAISISGIVIFWVAREVARAGLARPLLVTLAWASVLGAGIALLQAYGVDSDLFSQNRAPGGTFGNRNFMAHLAAIGLPLLLAVAIEAEEAAGFALCAGGVGILSAALVLSRSRASWLAVMISLLVFLAGMALARAIRADRLTRRRALRLIVAVAAGIALAVWVPNTLDWRSDSPYLESLRGVMNYQEGSGRGRLLQYGNTLRMAAAHPLFGVGPGNWPVEYPRYAPEDDPSLDADDGMAANPWPSSDWMALLSERGLPAFVILSVVVFATVGSSALRWRRSIRAPTRRSVELGSLVLAAAWVAVLVAGAFDAVLLLAAPALLAWATLGTLAPPAMPVRTWTVTPLTGILVVVLTLLAGGGAVFRSVRQVQAMAAYGEGWSRTGAERAARLDPGSYRLHIRLAEQYVRLGLCERVRAHASHAAALFPYADEPQRLLAACGGKARR
jgi:O-antigen ligase